jgi:cytosine/adenosine deaminase-related metal-dependent hydrolase
MRITGARVAIDAKTARKLDLAVRGGRVSFSDAVPAPARALDLTGFLLLPGLINAHDHLEFNLFPRLGRGPYPNAKAWAADIYHPDASPVKEQISLSKHIRFIWGGLKNLVSGVTTVAHHNACGDSRFDESFPVKVVKRFGWAHSLDFSPDLTEGHRATPADWPFIVHAAEGTDEHAHSEIARLEALGVLDDHTVLVHAIAIDQPDLELLRARGTSLVWCPASNLSIYGETIPAPVLRSGLGIALGTDSAMTAQGDLIDELHAARCARSLSAEELYAMVTTRAARVLRLTDGQGTIREGGAADLVAVADQGQSPAEALEHLQPDAVIVNGKIRLVSTRLRERVAHIVPSGMRAMCVEGRGGFFTDVNVPLLHEETARVLGPDFRLAGKQVLV